jgi:hypothetical protein
MNQDGKTHAGARLARRVFTVAAVYGILVLLPQYFFEDKLGRDFPPPITHPEHFYGFIGIALAWQVLFLIIARDPIRYRPAMIPAILEKLAFGVPCIILYVQGRLATAILAAGLIDLVLGTLFVASYRATAGTQQR